MGKTVTSRRNLETYSYNKYHPMGEVSKYTWQGWVVVTTNFRMGRDGSLLISVN